VTGVTIGCQMKQGLQVNMGRKKLIGKHDRGGEEKHQSL